MSAVSLSSKAMNNLAMWRNDVNYESVALKDRVVVISKVVVTQVALLALTVTSVAEAFFIACAIFLSTNHNVEERSLKLMQSALTALLWTASSLVYYNIFSKVLITNQREAANRFFPPHIARQFNQEHVSQNAIEAGAHFLINDVLHNDINSPRRSDFIEEFRSFYIFDYVLSKSVYMYAAGIRRNLPLPEFFKYETRNAIEQIRSNNISEFVFQGLSDIFLNNESFDLFVDDANPQRGAINPEVANFFARIRGIASREQSCPFARECCLLAVERLRSNQQAV